MEKVEERLQFRGLILGWGSDLDKEVRSTSCADGRRSKWLSEDPRSHGSSLVLALKTQIPPTLDLEKREQIPERRKLRESCLLLARLQPNADSSLSSSAFHSMIPPLSAPPNSNRSNYLGFPKFPPTRPASRQPPTTIRPRFANEALTSRSTFSASP